MYTIYRRVTQTLTGSDSEPHTAERFNNTPGCYTSRDTTELSHGIHGDSMEEHNK